MSPLVTALFIVLCVGMFGAMVAFVRDRMRYAGYRDIMREALAFSRTVDGEIFRDGGDLVVSGEQAKTPLIVRFSHAESTPGLSVRLGAPATFSMVVYPRGQHEHGGALVRTADDSFNTKFEVRSDQSTVAHIYLGSPRVLGALTQLCRTGHDFLTISAGAIEFGQLGDPSTATTRALAGHVSALSALRQGLTEMPGAELVRVEPRARRHDWLLRTTIAAGVIAAAATLYVTTYESGKDQKARAEAPLPEGMTVADAAAIGNLGQWRSATANDADGVMAGWFRDRGAQFAAHVVLDANGAGDKNDNAYLLTNDKGEHRLVLMVDGNKAYDARFSQLAAMMPVMRGTLSQLKWNGPAPTDPQGDGLLLVRNSGDTASGVVLYLSGNRVMSATPANWQAVPVTTP